MSLPDSLSAYRDCQELFEAAARGKQGCRARFADEPTAISIRTRLHYYRKLDRATNARIYPVDHPQHGTSIYDDFVVQLYPDEVDGHWVYIQRRSSKILDLEMLDEEPVLLAGPGPTDSTAHEVHLIEDHTDG